MNSSIVMNPSSAITALPCEMDRGNSDAISELLPLIYAQLRQIAASNVNRARRGRTLQASDLLQEVCLRIVKPNTGPGKSRRHSFAIASRSMRQVRVDCARAHGAKRRRGMRASIDLTNAADHAPETSATILAGDEALKCLAKLPERQSSIVERRFFSGRTIGESAAVFGVAVTTVKEEWAFGKTWLHRQLRKPR